MQKVNKNFFYIVGLFFFWGFVAASNDVLIPIFKDYLKLKQWQSQMIAFVFYVAYSIGSILYILISYYLKSDLLNKIGYAKGLGMGLIISFLGTLFFIPASLYGSFNALITGLLVIGLGFSLQQTAANPLVINAGNESYGSQRLSFAGGINNIGTTIGPLVVSYAVFNESIHSGQLKNLLYPYLVLGFAFLMIGLFFFFLNTNTKSQSDNFNSSYINEMKHLIQQPRVWMAMLAIFLYVGVEVSTAANMAEFAKHKKDIPTHTIAPYISLYWASLMIGRWASASDIFTENKYKKILLKIILSFAAFGLFYMILKFNHTSIPHLSIMFFYIALMLILDIISASSAAKQLLLYSLAGAGLIFTGMLMNGWWALYNIIAVGLFCSTLWPCIFEIALKNKGKHTGIVSNLLVMMIMGGGIISVLQGYLSQPLGINWSYIVGLICFLYLMLYGWLSWKKIE